MGWGGGERKRKRKVCCCHLWLGPKGFLNEEFSIGRQTSLKHSLPSITFSCNVWLQGVLGALWSTSLVHMCLAGAPCVLRGHPRNHYRLFGTTKGFLNTCNGVLPQTNQCGKNFLRAEVLRLLGLDRSVSQFLYTSIINASCYCF